MVFYGEDVGSFSCTFALKESNKLTWLSLVLFGSWHFIYCSKNSYFVSQYTPPFAQEYPFQSTALILSIKSSTGIFDLRKYPQLFDVGVFVILLGEAPNTNISKSSLLENLKSLVSV